MLSSLLASQGSQSLPLNPAHSLERFCRQLEAELGPLPTVEIPAPLLLADICDAFGLTPAEKQRVLGPACLRYLEQFHQTSIYLTGPTA